MALKPVLSPALLLRPITTSRVHDSFPDDHGELVTGHSRSAYHPAFLSCQRIQVLPRKLLSLCLYVHSGGCVDVGGGGEGEGPIRHVPDPDDSHLSICKT